MCGTCGCGDENNIRYSVAGEEDNHTHSHDHHHHDHEHPHNHEHSHNHPHDHSHDHTHSQSDYRMKEIQIEQNILSKNDLLAERNRGYFEAKNIIAINLVSSPGSGKTTLLEKTISERKDKKNFYVIEGDQQTLNDANRIKAAGAPAIQVNTGNGCHLDSDMINNAVKKLEVENDSILMIENVGNLVCPSLFDLGESKRVVVISTTEGEDKPIKYPVMFQTANLCIINKIDLLPYLDFDMEKCKEYAKRINPNLQFIEVSAKTGENMAEWYKWLENL
jgi:hydrogenase nickel incorporation protein HypB